MRYRVDRLLLARAEIPGHMLFWMSDRPSWHPICFQSVLIRGGDVVAIVNTGPAEDVSVHVDGERGFFGEGSRIWREDEGFIVEELARRGVAPVDVTHVILTPLTLHTLANLLLFEHAEIAIAKAGWEHFHVTKGEVFHDRESVIPEEILVHLVTDAWPRLRLLEDEDTLAPGLRTWSAGAHRRSSLCIEVDTDEGVVAITDAVYVHENLTRDHPIGVGLSLEEALAAQRRLRRSGATVVPLYDPS